MLEMEPSFVDPTAHLASVLVVEDDETLRDQLMRLFTGEGYHVATAANGAEALVYLITTETPRVVLLDWRMPEMDGMEVLAMLCLNRVAAARHTFLFMTTWREQVRQRLTAFTPYLRVRAIYKPFDLDDLLALVAQAAGQLTALVSTQERQAKENHQYASEPPTSDRE